ncbi:MAG: hypothetical protein K5785_04435 [Nitrosarchaeum sp.]|nr:hypothetical protein [Nitrosarchaeum sp.]
MSEIDSLKKENEDLRKFISLVLAEIELVERVGEIKQNFANSPDSERIITPIVDRILTIKEERHILQSHLDLK